MVFVVMAVVVMVFVVMVVMVIVVVVMVMVVVVVMAVVWGGAGCDDCDGNWFIFSIFIDISQNDEIISIFNLSSYLNPAMVLTWKYDRGLAKLLSDVI